MLSVELAELRPDLAKSALHFEYDVVIFDLPCSPLYKRLSVLPEHIDSMPSAL
jgi:hypothetical protein